ncbi:TAL effector repeat-containing protein [Xanthomonas oryzae]|nr:TAL effector repeat-containing protein [Xanthomonas oryzae]WEE99678.1 TAL effector repeat-containing protein [Xanthomonas oryzae]
MAQHHEALVGHGFTHAHIVALSQHPAALGTVAVTYQISGRCQRRHTKTSLASANSGPAHAPWRPCSRRRGS